MPRIQTGSGISGPADVTADSTWSQATTAGNFLIAVVAVSHNGVVTSITAPAGWTQAVFVANGALAFRAAAIFYYPNAPSQTTTGDFTASGASSGMVVVTAEYSLVSPTPAPEPLDKTASNFADVNGTTLDTGTTAATLLSQELGIGVFATGSAAVNNDPTGGYAIVTGVDNTLASGIARATLIERFTTLPAAQNCQVTAASQKWAAAVATFKLLMAGSRASVN